MSDADEHTLRWRKQCRRLAWAQIRVAALDIKDAQRRVYRPGIEGWSKTYAHQDLRAAEEAWSDAWHNLLHFRSLESL
jgi:hypothetical protein